eukprot:m.196171 g.196171  ORF g.196171 m.196171 type:complete len:84 (+) comp15696_c0_seq1:1274-1525(+)
MSVMPNQLKSYKPEAQQETVLHKAQDYKEEEEEQQHQGHTLGQGEQEQELEPPLLNLHVNTAQIFLFLVTFLSWCVNPLTPTI